MIEHPPRTLTAHILGTQVRTYGFAATRQVNLGGGKVVDSGVGRPEGSKLTVSLSPA